MFLDLTIFNLSDRLLENICLELYFSSNVKVLQLPKTLSCIESLSYTTNEAAVSLSEIASFTMFGVFSYTTNKVYKKLGIREVTLDMLNFITPNEIKNSEFRQKWPQLEWENKINVHFQSTDVTPYSTILDLAKRSKLAIVTSKYSAKENEGKFASVNLSAMTSIGDLVLMNLSIIRENDENLTGHCRIRCKSQNIALLIGESFSEYLTA